MCALMNSPHMMNVVVLALLSYHRPTGLAAPDSPFPAPAVTGGLPTGAWSRSRHLNALKVGVTGHRTLDLTTALLRVAAGPDAVA